MSTASFWSSLYQLGRLLAIQPQVHRSSDHLEAILLPSGKPFGIPARIDGSTLCIHIRGRTVEPVFGDQGKVLQQHRCLRPKSGKLRAVCKGLSTRFDPVTSTLRRAEALLRRHRSSTGSPPRRGAPHLMSLFVSGAVNLDAEGIELPQHLRAFEQRVHSLTPPTSSSEVRSSEADDKPSNASASAAASRSSFPGGDTEVLHALMDLKALSACPVIVLEDDARRSTFSLLAMLFGNHTQCGPALESSSAHRSSTAQERSKRSPFESLSSWLQQDDVPRNSSPSPLSGISSSLLAVKEPGVWCGSFGLEDPRPSEKYSDRHGGCPILSL